MAKFATLMDLLHATKNLFAQDYRAELTGDGWHIWHRFSGTDVTLHSLKHLMSLLAVAGERPVKKIESVLQQLQDANSQDAVPDLPLFSLLHAFKNAVAEGWRLEPGDEWQVSHRCGGDARTIRCSEDLLSWMLGAVSEPPYDPESVRKWLTLRVDGQALADPPPQINVPQETNFTAHGH